MKVPMKRERRWVSDARRERVCAKVWDVCARPFTPAIELKVQRSREEDAHRIAANQYSEYVLRVQRRDRS